MQQIAVPWPAAKSLPVARAAAHSRATTQVPHRLRQLRIDLLKPRGLQPVVGSSPKPCQREREDPRMPELERPSDRLKHGSHLNLVSLTAPRRDEILAQFLPHVGNMHVHQV